MRLAIGFASFFGFIFLAVLHLSATEPGTNSALAHFLGEAKFEGSKVFNDERFPNVVVTKSGAVLATWGASKIRSRRSEDGGLTWGPEILISEKGIHGGGTIVDERTGDILVFVEDRHPPAPLNLFRSSDDGLTWKRSEFTLNPDQNGRMPSMHMNEHGITLTKGKYAGRLVRATRFYGEGNRPESIWPTHFTNAIYSDDGGKTWQTSEPFPENGTGEATLTELADGTVYYNSRRHWAPSGKNPRRRWVASSKDSAETWAHSAICEVLPDGPQNTNYGCMAGLVRLPIEDRDILLYSNCDDASSRKNGTVWVSFDGGRHWPLKRLVEKDAFAYSSLNVGRAGTVTQGYIYLHYEHAGSKMARFNLSWLLDGTLTGDSELPSWVHAN